MNRRPVIALFPEASFGAALNCVGIAQELYAEGAEPVFICHPGFTGVFAEYGFREYHLPARPGDTADRAEDDWQTFIRHHLPHFNLSPIDQLATYVAPTWEAIVDTAIAAEADLETLLERIKPDAILLDNVIMFPAIARSGVPWVRVVSCAETELPGVGVPPYLSGLNATDSAACAAFAESYLAHCRPAHRRFNEFRRRRGLAALPPGVFLEPSPVLNLLLAPSCIRYPRAVPLPADTHVFLEGCVRQESPFEQPQFPAGEGPLVYLSFGSLGAIDTSLIGRMIDVFAAIQARFLVNVGGFMESYVNVPDNVHLGSWFPQPSVVADAALFIHHGGNNSFCEALYHGVPSLIMSYCWDGHDNARRAQDTGLGVRLDRSDWSPATLRAAITGLLDDNAMQARLAEVSRRMQRRPGPQVAARAVLDAIRVPT